MIIVNKSIKVIIGRITFHLIAVLGAVFLIPNQQCAPVRMLRLWGYFR